MILAADFITNSDANSASKRIKLLYSIELPRCTIIHIGFSASHSCHFFTVPTDHTSDLNTHALATSYITCPAPFPPSCTTANEIHAVPFRICVIIFLVPPFLTQCARFLPARFQSPHVIGTFGLLKSIAAI